MAKSWLAVVVLVQAVLLTAGADPEKCSVSSEGSRLPPNYSTALQGSYSISVEMTEVTQNVTYFVTEVHERRLYHDQLTDTVGVEVSVNDSYWDYQYYPEIDVMVQQFNGVCNEVAEQPNVAWGWIDKDPDHGPKSFGPSSILRLIAYLNTEYIEGPTVDEGIEVEVWKACAANNDVELHYHFSKPPWEMPAAPEFGDAQAALPIMMEVKLMGGGEHWRYTVVEFMPFILNQYLIEPPRGMSCEGMVGVVTDMPVPTLPKHFRLAEEIVLNSMIDGKDLGTQHMDKVQMTYAGEISLVSLIVTLPYDNMYSTSYALKIIHDHNTGTQYTIFKEYGNCSMERIPPFTFDSHLGGFLGIGDTLLSSNDLFHLDDNYGYVGERASRDLLGELWTSTRLDDIPDPATEGKQNYEKAVLEYYFSKGMERKPSGELITTDLPFRGDLFVYNKSDPKQIVGTLTTNYYDFRVLDLFSPDEFSVEGCFEKYDDQWSYVDIFFPVNKSNQFVAASEEQTRFKHEVMLKMIAIGRLSPVRIASIDVNTGSSGLIPNTTNTDMVVAKIKLLERAPYIFSYRKNPDEVYLKPGSLEPVKHNIRSSSDCAEICSSTTELNCISFHHCGSDCYLSNVTESMGDLLDIDRPCEHYEYDLSNQTMQDYPSETVFHSLFQAIKHGDFTFNVPYRNHTPGAGFEATMSIHYRTPDPLDPVRQQFTLEETMMTVAHPNDTIKVGDLTECLLLCVGWVRYRCETVIHLVQEKLCLLLSKHYHELDHTELVPHSEAFVHGRSYLVDYKPILGGVALNTTGPSYYPVEHLEACARHCTVETEIQCQSFEYCPSNQMCHLHAEHYLDVVDSGDYITGTACIHFSTKVDSSFTRYSDQGLQPSQHQLAAHMSSPSACAKMCMEDVEEVCQSYDFCSVCDKNNLDVCGEENKGRIGLCFLATHHLGESGLALTTGKGCDHFDRDKFGDLDYASWVSKQRYTEKPYTPGAMTGLAFGMIFLGILLSLGFLAAVTSLRPSSVPKDLEVTFQNLKTSSESDI